MEQCNYINTNFIYKMSFWLTLLLGMAIQASFLLYTVFMVFVFYRYYKDYIKVKDGDTKNDNSGVVPNTA